MPTQGNALPFPIAERCPVHDYCKGGSVGGCSLYACGCLVYEVNLYRAAAMDGAVDPRWLSPDDWYELEAKRLAERSPA